MSDEDFLIERVKYYTDARAQNRVIVMYGYHPELQRKFEKSKIVIKKVFTGNLDLLADTSLNCIPETELDGNSKSYYVILPFFLSDGGVAQRSKLKQYGYKEYKDYIFYPDTGDSTKEIIRGLKNKMATLSAEKNALRANSNPAADLVAWYLAPQRGEDELAAKKRFFGSLAPATGVRREMQLAGVILLSKLDKVCKANNIPYWISFGTLLGAIRHGGFIPWDDDTDICMMRSDAIRFTEIMSSDEDFFVSHIFAEFDDNLNHCVQFKYRVGAPYCLDIFIYDYCNDPDPTKIRRQMELNRLMAAESQELRKIPDRSEKNRQFGLLMDKYLEASRKDVGISDTPTDNMIWALDNFRCDEHFQGNCRIDYVFPLKRIMFEGLELNAPWSAEEYLAKKYGDIYSLPNDILSHIHFKLNSTEEKTLGNILKKYRYLLNNEV